MTRSSIGISAFGIQLPKAAIDLDQLADARSVPAEKYTIGLGCQSMSICLPDEGAVELAVGAARRALDHWGGEPSRIGLLAVATESAIDMSRPLSAWVAEALGIRGAVRSYEIKHACYGGTVALRQAVEWLASGAARPGEVALVVASDVALYEPGSPGEPTQGAGAVAMVVGEPEVASIELRSHAWSEPAFDFWRPVGESFPRVDGPFSLDCYCRATVHCFRQWLADRSPDQAFEELSRMCFHVPFPKMVRKAVAYLGTELGWTDEQIDTCYRDRVEPTMEWNRRVGNAYTASLWLAVARALAGRQVGETLTAFSYGSGFGAELLTLRAGSAAAAGAWTGEVESDLATRQQLDIDSYQRLRGQRPAAA